MDVLLKGARELGVPAIVTLWRTPAWAARSPRHPAPTGVPQLAAWRSYVMAAATRYSGHHPDPAGGVLPRVSAWEIWNESNLSRYFSPQVGSPELYTELLNAAYDAIKAVGARHGYRQTVAGGSLYRSGASGVAPIPFLRGMRAANARFDVISVHPYNAVPGLGPREGEGDTTGNNVATGNFGRLIREADRLWPGRRPRFWVTEYGWKSWPDRVQGVAPDLQARFLRDGVRTFRALHPRVEVLVWFLLRDEPLRYPDGHAGWQTGLRYVDGRPKPSYAAFRELRG
jgi:hypothetical protein